MLSAISAASDRAGSSCGTLTARRRAQSSCLLTLHLLSFCSPVLTLVVAHQPVDHVDFLAWFVDPDPGAVVHVVARVERDAPRGGGDCLVVVQPVSIAPVPELVALSAPEVHVEQATRRRHMPATAAPAAYEPADDDAAGLIDRRPE